MEQDFFDENHEGSVVEKYYALSDKANNIAMTSSCLAVAAMAFGIVLIMGFQLSINTFVSSGPMLSVMAIALVIAASVPALHARKKAFSFKNENKQAYKSFMVKRKAKNQLYKKR